MLLMDYKWLLEYKKYLFSHLPIHKVQAVFFSKLSVGIKLLLSNKKKDNCKVIKGELSLLC
jgi:hypothetical protein